MKKIILATGGFLMLPLVTLAQFNEVNDFFGNINQFIGDVLIPLVFGLTLLMFIWGMFRFFIWGGHNEDDRSKGKQLIIWSIIALVLMTSIWGIVNMISGGLFDNNKAPVTPAGPTIRS